MFYASLKPKNIRGKRDEKRKRGSSIEERDADIIIRLAGPVLSRVARPARFRSLCFFASLFFSISLYLVPLFSLSLYLILLLLPFFSCRPFSARRRPSHSIFTHCRAVRGPSGKFTFTFVNLTGGSAAERERAGIYIYSRKGEREREEPTRIIDDLRFFRDELYSAPFRGSATVLYIYMHRTLRVYLRRTKKLQFSGIVINESQKFSCINYTRSVRVSAKQSWEDLKKSH